MFFQPCSEMHAACMCIGVALPPYSRSALPCVRVTHYGLSKQMACPQRWYNFLGGRSCETKCHLSTHRENAISCLHSRKQKPKTHPAPLHCLSLLISTTTWIPLLSEDPQLRLFFLSHNFFFFSNPEWQMHRVLRKLS